MPVSLLKPARFLPTKDATVSWDQFRKGLNLLLRENELTGNELTTATNLLLVGSGIPTKRWGSQNYYLAGPTTALQGRFVMPIKDASDNQDVISLTDWGILTKKSGTSYTAITGASWPSGSNIEATQLGGNVYLSSDTRELVRYDFSTLTNFATLAIPTSLSASNISGATGSSTWSWRVTAIGKSGGETVASTAVSLTSLPQNLTSTVMRIAWTAVSAASGDLQGYNIYRGTTGDERWVGGVDSLSTVFFDYGTPAPDPFRVVPVADTTGGPKAKYIIRFQDRLIMAGIPGEPTKVLISGRFPDQERFDWYAGGGYVYIEPDSGQNVTGLGIHQEKLVVFKENSVWQVSLNQITFGQYIILDPQYKLLTASQGCSSHKSIVPLENDLAFANRKGMFILRYEPQLLTVLNAAEISAKVRPFFEGLTDADLTSSAGAYIDKKYVLSFPTAKQSISFDRERLAFMGPWNTPFGIAQWARYVDAGGTERWIAMDSSDTYVTEFQKTLLNDKGTAIHTILKTRKEDFGDWTLYKTFNEVYTHFRSVAGSVSVNIYIEDRNGNTIVAKSFTITASGAAGTSGIGTDGFGLAGLGLTNNNPSASVDELQRKSFIYKTSRTMQIEVRTDGTTDNYEFLGTRFGGIPQSRGNSPSSWNT